MAQAWQTVATTKGTADGRQIAVASTSQAAPTALFDTPADATKTVEVFAKVVNRTNSPIVVGVLWGGVANSDLEPVPLDPYESRIVSNVFKSAVALTVGAYMISGSASDANASAYSLQETNT